MLLLLPLAACGGRGQGEATPPRARDLSSAEMMVLPVQRVADAPDADALALALDAEIEYWATERAQGLPWTFPPALERVVARNPELGVTLRALPVAVLRRQPDFIPDPLLGHLRKLGAVANRRLALVPWQAERVAVEGGDGWRLRLHVAIIDTHGGRVLWQGAVQGDEGGAGDPAATASAARALTGALLQ